MAAKRLIDCYPYRIINGEPRFLLFRRAGGKIYEDQWRMVGGKVKEGETFWQGALRELKEETGLKPVTFWTIPGINSFYEHSTDTVHQIPAFAAELDPEAEPELDDEHSAYEWFPAGEAAEKVAWPEQKRLIRLAETLILNHQILDDWIIKSD